jgi:hypothetical protein
MEKKNIAPFGYVKVMPRHDPTYPKFIWHVPAYQKFKISFSICGYSCFAYI